MSPADSQPSSSLTGRKVLLGVSGGIACFKAAALCSMLVQSGAAVRVVMTRAARKFIGPVTFQALTGQAVITSIWQRDDHPESQHVGLARWCEAMVIAPATADLIARLAAGLCDDPVTLAAAALPRNTPLLLAPAMNEQMWESPITQRNLATLREMLRCKVIGPSEGWQACRTAGPGRMSEPAQIIEALAGVIGA